MNTLGSSISPMLARLPADVTAPLIGVDGVYLDTAFAQLRQDYGSVDGFMEKELGVGPREREQLRRRMLAK
jgi:protein-tyrosine phosphatase